MQAQKESSGKSTPEKSKVQAMALRYQKYLTKNPIAKQENPTVKVAKNWAIKLHSSIFKLWSCILPISIRGPITPYEALSEKLNSQQKQHLKNLSFSKKSLAESIVSGSPTILLTIKYQSIFTTLNKLNNNQQLNLLTRNKVEVIPIYLKPSSNQNQLSFKVKEFLSARNLEDETNFKEFVLVCWKGLFNEILIIDFFSLEDLNLCNKVMNSLQKRSLYEEQVKETAGYSLNETNLLQKSDLALKRSSSV